MDDFLERDEEVVNAGIVRREVEVMRPCHMGPCEYGELTEEKRAMVKHWLKNNIMKI